MRQSSEEHTKRPESPKQSQLDILDLKTKFAKLLESQRLPFVITEELIRLLDDILYLYNKCSPDNNVLYLIKEQLDYERIRFEDEYDPDYKYFWQYLEEQNIAVPLTYIKAEDMEKKAGNISIPKLIAIGRPHKREKPIEKFFARPGHWKEDLEKVARLTRENEQDENYIPYLAVRVFEIELVKELFYFLKNKFLEKDVENESDHIEPSVQVVQNSKVTFDSLNGVVRFGDERLRFHRGERGNKPRLTLFKELWVLKKNIKNGKIKAEGRSFPPETLAVRLNMISGAGDFQRNKQKQEQFYGLIKGINRELRNKNIPAVIERNNGVQLVITEK